MAGTVRIYKDGALQLSGWSVNVTTGLITFTTAPAAGVEIAADFEFDVPARFDTDHMAVTIETFRLTAGRSRSSSSGFETRGSPSIIFAASIAGDCGVRPEAGLGVP